MPEVGRLRPLEAAALMSTAMTFGRKSFQPKPPEKGAFPLDHFGERRGYEGRASGTRAAQGTDPPSLGPPWGASRRPVVSFRSPLAKNPQATQVQLQ